MLNATAINIETPKPHWDANLYKHNSIQLQYMNSMEVLQKEDLKGALHVLDIGCGEGKITKEIASCLDLASSRVVGIDFSESMISLAKTDFSKIPNLTFHVMNAEEITLEDKFDKIYSFFCLQWVPDKQKAFHEIARLLKEGGSGVIITTNRNPYLLKARRKLIQSEQWKNLFHDIPDPSDVIDNMDYQGFSKNAGLTCVGYKEFPQTIMFETEKDFRNFITMISAQAKSLPEELKSEFINQLIELYKSFIPEENETKNYIEYNIMITYIEK